MSINRVPHNYKTITLVRSAEMEQSRITRCNISKFRRKYYTTSDCIARIKTVTVTDAVVKVKTGEEDYIIWRGKQKYVFKNNL